MTINLKDDAMTQTESIKKANKRPRSVLAAVVVGAVVGALVSAGVVISFRNDSTTTVVRTAKGTEVISRASNQITGSTDVAAIISKSQPAIVAVTAKTDSGEAAGTGFVITEDGYIVTNNHVIDGANLIEVAFTNGSIKEAKLVGKDPSVDLAVLKVDGSDLATVALGDSDAVQVGDDVVAIGNALALEGGLSVTRGIISGTDRTVATNTGANLVGMLQTDAAINPGNSGGPLLDSQARVIGINTAIANPSSAQGVGFAIPISAAKPIIEDLRLGRTPAFLGVSTQSITPALARERSLNLSSGAYVAKVTAGSAAKEAGLEVGDVITEIEGSKISDSTDVLTAIREHRPGDSISIVISRNGDKQTLRATLTDRPS